MINTIQALRFLVVLLGTVLTTQAYAETWRSIQEKSELQFIANYEGAEAPGHFSHFEVVIGADPASGDPASLQVNVDITSASMGNADMDEAIAEPEWFDTQAFPRAVFRSGEIRSANDSEYIAEGVVSIKGTDRPISVPFHWNPGGERADMSGSVSLSRLDFGIGSGAWASDSSIGYDVQVRFRVALKAE